jgi:type IV pilus assembly protein PilC
MPRYTYRAINKSGATYQGTYVAATKDEVLKMLRNNQSYPVKITEEDLSQNLTLFKAKKLSSKELSVFCRQLYAMLNAGVPIIQSLEILRYQTVKKTLKSTLDEIYEEVQKGMIFSEALRRHRDVFPDIMIHMVEAGELSGNLDIAVMRLSTHFEREGKLKSKVVNAMIYPMVLAVASVLVVTFLLVFIMPTFTGMFDSSGVELPGLTRFVMAISDALRDYWYAFIGAIALISFVVSNSLKTPEGKFFVDRMILRLPVFGKTMALVLSSRFTRTLSTLLSSGIPLIQALENIERVIGNKVISDELVNVRQEVQRGASLAVPISKIKIFPPMVSSMIHIGEESGTLDEILGRTADFYDEESDTALTRMAALMEPLMILIMGVLIGIIVIAMLLPIFDMTKTVG